MGRAKSNNGPCSTHKPLPEELDYILAGKGRDFNKERSLIKYYEILSIVEIEDQMRFDNKKFLSWDGEGRMPRCYVYANRFLRHPNAEKFVTIDPETGEFWERKYLDTDYLEAVGDKIRAQKLLLCII